MTPPIRIAEKKKGGERLPDRLSSRKERKETAREKKEGRGGLVSGGRAPRGRGRREEKPTYRAISVEKKRRPKKEVWVKKAPRFLPSISRRGKKRKGRRTGY